MNLDLQLFRELEQAIMEQLEAQASQLVNGQAASFDDYRARTGRIRGLRDALEIARGANARVIGVSDRKDR